MSGGEREETAFPLEMARLGLWYVHRLLERGEISSSEIARALTRRVDIYRSTRLYDGVHDTALGFVDPEWDRLTVQLADLIRGESQFEARGVAMLADYVLLDANPYRLVGDGRFGCWRYELAWEGYKDTGGRIARLANPELWMARARKVLKMSRKPARNAALHFANAMPPESPFDHMEELAASLASLIADCRAQYPHMERLWCGTWLNSHRKFQQLFPEVWHRNARPQPPGNFGNWWGQFQSRTGGFHYALAQKFRASGGDFPYPALMGHALLTEVAEHLRRNFET